MMTGLRRIMKKQIELLAPAGNREALHAAVENGADAVYLGGKLFSARMQADNFDIEILKEELQYSHARGASVYLTMNTLVSDDEMEQALEFAVQARSAGIDGIIVQDIGLAGALRRVMPDMPLHASTQMTVYDLSGVKFLEEAGFRRVVLARELTLEEASDIARNTELEVEVFIHGALCISYSGQCLMSSMIGGRSGNRGKCAQPCRLPYKLTGPVKEQGSAIVNASNAGYLLSTKDICTLDYIGDIITSGIRSLKIEGRMKSPEYVATVVRIYRKYIDLAIERISRGEPGQPEIDEADRHDLLQVFNRGGFSSGYMKGKCGADMMCFDKPNNSGVYLGNVIAYDSRTQMASIRLEDRLSVGDGIEIRTGLSGSAGGNVSAVKKGKQELKSATRGDLVDIGYFRGRITPGDKVYKTVDIELNKEARKSFASGNSKRVKIKGIASLKFGQPLMLNVEDYDGYSVKAVGSVLPEKAINKPLTEKRLKEQLDKTGSTPFCFDFLQVEIDDGLSIPVSEINEVRRQALDKLLNERADRYKEVRSDTGISTKLKEVLRRPVGTNPGIVQAQASGAAVKEDRPLISLYYYRWDQSTNPAGLGADRVYLPFASWEKPGFIDALQELKQEGTEVFGWIPSITRGNYEEVIGRFLSKMSNLPEDQIFDGILAGNAGTFRKFRGCGLRMAGDIPMNLYNAMSVYEAAKLGLESVALSLELTVKQINTLSSSLISGPALEAAVYGRLPLMVSEYCPVGCVLGGYKGSSKCSGCCGEGRYLLKDRLGIEFPVLTDRLDCRSTILNSRVLFMAEGANSLKKAGISIFRLYILDEEPEDVKELVRLFRTAAAGGNGETSGSSSEALISKRISERIKAAGYTKGHYYRGV